MSVAGPAGDVLGAIQAAGEVTRLEDALNRNLAALAGSKNFEETVVSLAAAIHLLTRDWATCRQIAGGTTRTGSTE